MQNRLAPKLKTKDRVLVFFAGHGYTETLGGKDRGYIVPYDGDTQSAGYISMDELETLSDYMGDARHQVFVMDSCYGGLLAVTRASLVNPNIPDYLNNVADRVARQVITAGGKNQQVLDGGPKGHSYFVDYLLEALADGKADTNGDGYITFSELSSYLGPRASNRQQTPMFGSLAGHQAGEYLFRSPLGRLVPLVSKNEPVSGPVRGAGEGTITLPGGTEATKPVSPGGDTTTAYSQPPPDPNDPMAPHDPGIYYAQQNAGSRRMIPLEPAPLGNQMSGGAILGSRWAWRSTINGSQAHVRITETRPIFYFYLTSSQPGFAGVSSAGFSAVSPREFVLAHLESMKNGREVPLEKAHSVAGPAGVRAKDTVSFAYDKIAPGIYRIEPQAGLKPGEYGFLYAGSVQMPTGRLFDFGIEGAQ